MISWAFQCAVGLGDSHTTKMAASRHTMRLMVFRRLEAETIRSVAYTCSDQEAVDV